MRFYHFFRQRLFPRLIAKCLKLLMQALSLTLRYELKGEKPFIENAEKQGCILLFWHNKIALLPELFTFSKKNLSFAALISNSRDGEIIASICESYCKNSAIRVQHQAKFAALKKALETIEKERKVLAITPDGPKGPRYKIKKGVALAASFAKCPVYSVSWCSTKFWQLSSWDRLLIPKPFSKVYVSFSPPLFFSEEKDLIGSLEKIMIELDREVEKEACASVK